MKLTMTAVGWAGEVPAINRGDVIRYQVQGLLSKEQAIIESTTTGAGTTWAIRRNWGDAEGEYALPEEALGALEKEIAEAEKSIRYVRCKFCGKPHRISDETEPSWSGDRLNASLQISVALNVRCSDNPEKTAAYGPSDYKSATAAEWKRMN